MHHHDLPAQEPVLSLLLEPLSFVITAQDQYAARAYGIDSVTRDRVGELCGLTRRFREGARREAKEQRAQASKGREGCCCVGRATV
jgi:hypothetical protein